MITLSLAAAATAQLAALVSAATLGADLIDAGRDGKRGADVLRACAWSLAATLLWTTTCVLWVAEAVSA